MGCRCGAVTPLEARPDLEAVAAAARGAGPTRNAVSAAHDLARIPSGLEKLAFPAFGELSAIEPLFAELRAALQPQGTEGYRRAAGGAEQAERERRALWIARLIAAVLPAERVLAARPIAEQVLESCRDPVNRALACCLLTRIATRAGDVDAAHAWLSGCPEAPEELALDSAWRECRVFLFAHLVLQTVGERPLAPANELALGLARVAALERSGEARQASEHLMPLLDVFELDMADALRREPEALAPVRQTLTRRMAEVRRRAMPKLWLYGLGVVSALIFGVVASYYGRVVKVTCTRDAPGPSCECSIETSVWGQVTSTDLERNIRGAKRRLHVGNKNKKSYSLALVTSAGAERVVSPVPTSDQEQVDVDAARVNDFVRNESARQMSFALTNDGSLLVAAVLFTLVFVLPFIAVARVVIGRRPRGAAARVLTALERS